MTQYAKLIDHTESVVIKKNTDIADERSQSYNCLPFNQVPIVKQQLVSDAGIKNECQFSLTQSEVN